MKPYKANRILVTGSTGFIGNHVIVELLKYNVEIIATGIQRIEDVNYDWLPKVKYIQSDLNLLCKDWFSFFRKPDLVIHLAWQGLPNYNEKFHIDNNLPNNFEFLKNLVINGCKNINVTGTCFEYGLQNGKLSEIMEPKPNNYYSTAKDNLRKLLEEFQKSHHFNFKWIRLFYMFGKGQNPRSIIAQLEMAISRKEKVFNMSGGEQLRDYLAVEKVAEYIVKISLQNEVNGIINCCSGKPVSIKSLVESYLKSREYNLKLNLGYYGYNQHEPMEFWGDAEKLHKVIRSELPSKFHK
jgi:nucleoside-diphosphate-sugar epimerase